VNLESKLKTELASECRKLGAYARRLEDRYAIGLLDLTIKFPGYPHLMAEGKIVDHQSFGPTPRQYEEGRRYQAAGGLCCLIGWDKASKAMFVHEWAKVANKANSFPPGGGFKNHGETLKEWLHFRENWGVKWQTTK
jgi:hypothetical protein